MKLKQLPYLIVLLFLYLSITSCGLTTYLKDHKEIFIKVLDWPLLLFILLFSAIVYFRGQLRGILDRGGVTISWGDKSIRLDELSDHMDLDLDDIHAEIHMLKEEIHKLHPESQLDVTKTNKGKRPSEEEKLEAAKVMKQILNSGRWRWRSMEHLSIQAGITDSEAYDILNKDPEVIVGHLKSGHPAAKLKQS